MVVMFAVAVVKIADTRTRDAANDSSLPSAGESTDPGTACGPDPDSFQGLHVPFMLSVVIIISIRICGGRLGRAPQ